MTRRMTSSEGQDDMQAAGRSARFFKSGKPAPGGQKGLGKFYFLNFFLFFLFSSRFVVFLNEKRSASVICSALRVQHSEDVRRVRAWSSSWDTEARERYELTAPFIVSFYRSVFIYSMTIYLFAGRRSCINVARTPITIIATSTGKNLAFR